MNRQPAKPISANPFGKSAEKILAEPAPIDSSGYFFRAIAWLDFALRADSPSAIHYAAFDLRYGIEVLLFEILVVCGAISSEAEYRKCLGNQAKYMKAILKANVKYAPLAGFVREVEALAPSGVPYAYWDLDELMKAWGVSSRYLHFIGLEEYRKPLWIGEALSGLEQVAKPIWKLSTETAGTISMRPSNMSAEILDAQNEWASGNMDLESLRLRLKLIQPVLELRKRVALSQIIRFAYPAGSIEK